MPRTLKTRRVRKTEMRPRLETTEMPSEYLVRLERPASFFWLLPKHWCVKSNAIRFAKQPIVLLTITYMLFDLIGIRNHQDAP